MDEKDAFLDKALKEGIIVPDEMPNPKLPGKVVAVCHLNRENDIVKQILPKI
jgi:co-chaperonin GroES (HSP10)